MGERDHRLSSNAAVLTKTQTSHFPFVNENNYIPRSIARKSKRLHSRRIAGAVVCWWETRFKKCSSLLLSVGKVYPHVSSLVCGGTGPRSTQREQRRDSLRTAKSTGKQEQGAEQGERRKRLQHGWQCCIWQTKPETWLLYFFIKQQCRHFNLLKQQKTNIYIYLEKWPQDIKWPLIKMI